MTGQDLPLSTSLRLPAPRLGPRPSERGFALVAVLIALVAMTGLIVLSQLSSRTELRIGANTYANSQAYYAAEAGAEKLLASVRAQMANGYVTQAKIDAMPMTPPTISGMSFTDYKATLDSTVTVRSISQGAFAGLSSLDQDLVVTASVQSSSGARSTVEVAARTQAIPVFQFGAFYDQDLEIMPGPRMDLRGRVHTNGDLYVDGNDGLYFWDMVTSAGDLHLHREASTGGGTDGRSNFLRKSDGSWVELMEDTHNFGGDDNPVTFPTKNQDQAFDDYSTSTWEHRLQTRASGIAPMRLPIPVGLAPYSIVQPCTGTETPDLAAVRYACQAGLKIKVSGNVLKVTNGAGALKILTNPTAVTFVPNKFYDDREQGSNLGTALNATNATSNRDVIEIDVSKLTAAEYGNGILYVTADSLISFGLYATKDLRQYVVRVRGGQLLQKDLTIATNLPLYVMGDFNKDDSKWQAASFASDVITILSKNWDDTKSGEGATENKPDDITIQAAILAGHSATPFYLSPDAGGQFENFPRFLEDWTGKKVTLDGSLVSLWTPQVTASAWGCCDYYVPPDRDWNFDPRFLDPTNLPPATPAVGQVLRVGFVRKY